MKVSQFGFLVAIALITFLFSCEKDQSLTPNPSFNETPSNSNNSNGGGTSDQFMKATVDGQSITFPICEADTFGFFGSEFELNGEFPPFSPEPFSNHRFSFEIYDPAYVIKADTTYSLDSNAYITAIYENNLFSLEDSTVFFSKTGQIRFTVATPSGYEGTFNFTARNATDTRTVTITNGSFKAVIDPDK